MISPVLDDKTFKKPSLNAFCVPETVVEPPSFDVLMAEAEEIFSSPLNLAALKLVLSKLTVIAELKDEKSLFNTSISTVFGELNAEIWMSSPSAFSMTICFLSEERFATTPVLPEKLFIALAKFVRSVERIAAVISASFPTPGLLKRLNEIVPSEDGALSLTLVEAVASMPRVFASSLMSPATKPADDSIGTEIFLDFPVDVEFTVSVYAAVT